MATKDPYAPLARVADPHTRAAMKLLIDQIVQLRGQADGVGTLTRPLAQPLDASGHPLTSIADAVHDGDAVNLRTLNQAIQGILTGSLRPTPARGGVAPGVITSPPGPPPPPPPNPPPDPPDNPPGPPDPPTNPPPTGPWPPPQGGTGNLRVVGKFFRTPGGAVYRWKSATDFLLFKRYLDGENIIPILADRVGEGASMVRVLGMCVNIADFRPVNYPNYLSQLPTFLAILASASVDCEFVVFADAQAITEVKNVVDQRAWFTSVQTAVAGIANVVLELVNEGFQNGVKFSDFTRPSGGILACPDSGQQPGDAPATPPWDYATLHTPRDSEWPRKSKDVMEVADQLNRPAVADEPMGADEVDIPGKRSNVPNDFYYYAATGMLLGLTGGTFHSSDGITSTIFRPVTRTCAQSFYAGINVIPDAVLSGRYTRGPLADCPIQHDDALALRTFARYTDHLAVCVVIRPTGAWVAIAQAGWTITSQAGPGGCIVFLSK